MIHLFSVILFFFYQYPTATPNPTVIPPATIEALDDQVEDIQATLDAFEMQDDDFELDDTSFTFEGEELNPNLDSNPHFHLLMSYMKWMVSSDASTLFGPMHSVIVSIGILLALSIYGVVWQFIKKALTIAINFMQWVVRWIIRFIGMFT